jgi:NTP pyrophosphatase (non-canonical NTP hydrolase)
MNILDVNPEEILKKYEKTDKLKAMMELQAKLAKKYGLNLPVHLDSKEGQQTIRDLIFAITEEMFEMSNTLKNRAWTNTVTSLDQNHFLDEFADTLLFFIELLVATGMSVDRIFEIYARKYMVNLFRIETNY